MSDLVLQRDDGRVRILVLNRPEARNALSAALRQQLIAALKAAEADSAIGAIVLTGVGSTFAAGADLKEMLERSGPEQRAFLQPPHIYSTIENLTKPVIAAVNGHALGAGLELATACDVRIAARSAKLGQPEIRLGLIPGGGGTQRLVRLAGTGNTARLVLTGQAVTADEAREMGIVDVVVEPQLLEAQAIALAAQMALNDPVALAAAKMALAVAREAPYSEGLRVEIEAFMGLHARPEAKQRIRAFLEGRT